MLAAFPAYAEKCRIGGCSGEICEADNGSPAVGICIWSEQFACYKTAKCEEQADGKCGWTQTPELKKCLEEKKNSTVQPVLMEQK